MVMRVNLWEVLSRTVPKNHKQKKIGEIKLLNRDGVTTATTDFSGNSQVEMAF
jgi:hypothetical protein